MEPGAVPPQVFDVGDRVVVAVWRPVTNPRLGEPAGAWSPLNGRIVSVRKDGSQFCYETESQAPFDYDTPTGTPRRFCKREHVFSTYEAAVEACRTLTPPT